MIGHGEAHRHSAAPGLPLIRGARLVGVCIAHNSNHRDANNEELHKIKENEIIK